MLAALQIHGPGGGGTGDLIISRTPFRISFFGGGTDYPAWYNEEKGAVLVSTIDKYCYISCRWLPPFFPHRHRIVYSQMETVSEIEEIDHPAVREVLQFLQVKDGVEIHHDGDLPARTGLGSSSSFTVGLLHSLYALKGAMVSKMRLAKEAIYVEQHCIGENVGSQDQTSTALGGLNRIEFSAGDHISVQQIMIPAARRKLLNDHLMLFFTGFSRTASEIAAEQIRNTPRRKRELREMYGMVDEALGILTSEGDIREFGRLLDETWRLKRSLSSQITTRHIDAIYDAARGAGAIGGKLLGAGGGGFLLIFAEPELQAAVRASLGDLLHVPFRFEDLGSQIIVYQPDSHAAG